MCFWRKSSEISDAPHPLEPGTNFKINKIMLDFVIEMYQQQIDSFASETFPEVFRYVIKTNTNRQLFGSFSNLDWSSDLRFALTNRNSSKIYINPKHERDTLGMRPSSSFTCARNLSILYFTVCFPFLLLYRYHRQSFDFDGIEKDKAKK